MPAAGRRTARWCRRRSWARPWEAARSTAVNATVSIAADAVIDLLDTGSFEGAAVLTVDCTGSGCDISVNGPTLTIKGAAEGTGFYWNAHASDRSGNTASTQCFTTVPEPGTGWLLLAGVGALLGLRRWD